jgi:hypothetical protein
MTDAARDPFAVALTAPDRVLVTGMMRIVMGRSGSSRDADIHIALAEALPAVNRRIDWLDRLAGAAEVHIKNAGAMNAAALRAVLDVSEVIEALWDRRLAAAIHAMRGDPDAGAAS